MRLNKSQKEYEPEIRHIQQNLQAIGAQKKTPHFFLVRQYKEGGFIEVTKSGYPFALTKKGKAAASLRLF